MEHGQGYMKTAGRKTAGKKRDIKALTNVRWRKARDLREGEKLSNDIQTMYNIIVACGNEGLPRGDFAVLLMAMETGYVVNSNVMKMVFGGLKKRALIEPVPDEFSVRAGLCKERDLKELESKDEKELESKDDTTSTSH